MVGVLCILIPAACGDDGVAPVHHQPSEEPRDTVPALVWPLAATGAVDADSIHAPYGPRWIGSYDFHAGIDLPAATGRQVSAVMAGTVAQVRTWDGNSRGAGNAILLHHSYGRSTSYLHLETTRVTAGQRVDAGTVIGTVGRTGATYPHLHFGYMQGLPGNTVDERRSRNPLELLPHNAPQQIPSIDYVDPHTVRLVLPLQSMTVRSISLIGDGPNRTLDYYDVVAVGSLPRNAEVHDGIRVMAGSPENGQFPLTLGPDPTDFAVERVVVVDIHGDTIADDARPD